MFRSVLGNLQTPPGGHPSPETRQTFHEGWHFKPVQAAMQATFWDIESGCGRFPAQIGHQLPLRMELPMAGASDRDAQTQVADVVVGDDGLVRAIRIVN